MPKASRSHLSKTLIRGWPAASRHDKGTISPKNAPQRPNEKDFLWLRPIDYIVDFKGSGQDL